jgi:hypothetical protein
LTGWSTPRARSADVIDDVTGDDDDVADAGGDIGEAIGEVRQPKR